MRPIVSENKREKVQLPVGRGIDVLNEKGVANVALHTRGKRTRFSSVRREKPDTDREKGKTRHEAPLRTTGRKKR